MAFAVDCSSATFAAACGAILYLIFFFHLESPISCAIKAVLGRCLWHTIVRLFRMVLLRTVDHFFTSGCPHFTLFSKRENVPVSYLQLLIAGVCSEQTYGCVRPSGHWLAFFSDDCSYLRENTFRMERSRDEVCHSRYIIGMFVLAYLVNNKRPVRKPI